MLRLAWSTPPSWAARVAEAPLALLADHAHCEAKAAAAARALLDREPGARSLGAELEAIEREEREHHARVQAELARRGGQEGTFRGNPYVQGLLGGARRGGARLLDRLLIAGLIEARSLERFQLLAELPGDAALAALYRGLLASEAGHTAFFFRAARALYPGERAARRLAELREHEARLIRGLPFGPRMHSGPPPEPAS